MSDQQTTEAESFDVYGVTFDFEPQVGMTVSCDSGDVWICWADTVKLTDWLAAKVKACKSNG